MASRLFTMFKFWCFNFLLLIQEMKQSSETLEMSPDVAKKLMEEGGTCICLGVSPGTDFGIDIKSWTTADKFMGVKMIPPGFHYIHYSMKNKYGDVAPRTGFVWTSCRSDIIVKKWNEIDGQFEDESAETIERLKSNLKDVDKHLGPYPYEVWEKWKSLTSKITEPLANKFVPDSGIIQSVLDLTGVTDAERKDVDPEIQISRKRQRRSVPFSDVDTYGDLLPNLQAAAGTVLRFSRFPEAPYPSDATPSQITKHSLDSSYLLQKLIDQHEKPADILGELQFAYVSFLVGHSMEGFEQWKRLIGVLCSVQDLLPRYSSVYLQLLNILEPQLDEIPEDFLVDIVASNNFVYQSLRKLFRNIASEKLDNRLKSKASRLQETITQKLMWDFSDVLEDEDDELPVVVDT